MDHRFMLNLLVYCVVSVTVSKLSVRRSAGSASGRCRRSGWGGAPFRAVGVQMAGHEVRGGDARVSNSDPVTGQEKLVGLGHTFRVQSLFV